MSQSENSLLLRIRGDSSGGTKAVNETRAAIAQLKNSATQDLKQIQTASASSLGSITQTTAQLTANLPVVGRAINALSNQFTSLTVASQTAGAGVAGIAGPAAIAVAGFVATGAAVATLGRQLFTLAESAAAFQGKLFDMSQQVGVSVETLSALEVVARTTGGSIEQITASLGIFQKNMEEAIDPTTKQAEAFKRLGVEVTTTEETFRATLTQLARMPEGFRQTALALELFGRGGKAVLAILKETNGDLDGTIQKLRGMGLVTAEQARQADIFNDQLVLLQVALRGLGTEAIPVVIDVLTRLQKTIKDNRDAFEALQLSVKVLTGLFTLPLKGAIGGAEAVWKSHRAEVALVIETYQILAGAIRGAIAEIPKVPIPAPGQESGIALLKQLQAAGAGRQFPFTPAQDFSKIEGLFRPDPKKAAAEAAKALAEAEARAAQSIALQQASLEERTREHRVALERERELDLRSIEERELAAEKIANDHLESQTTILDQELANIRRFIKNQEDRLLAETAIQQKRTELNNRTAEELQRIDDEAQRRRDQSALNLEQQLIGIRDAEREGELTRIKSALDRKEIAESDALTRQLAIEKQAFEDRKLLRDLELEQITTGVERRGQLLNEQLEDEIRFTDNTKELIQQRIDAREEEIRRSAPGAEGVPDASTRVLSDEQIGELGEIPDAPIRNLTQAFDELGLSIANAAGLSGEFATQVSQDFADVLNSGFRELSAGIGEIVRNYVLLGETGPAALKKVLAASLATIAAESAQKAIYYTAMGIASLFVNPAAAGGYFTAAALFAGLAAGAAVAGRAIAGDSFKRPSSSGSGESSTSPQALQTIIQDRNRPQINVTVSLQGDDSKLANFITASVVSNMGDGGKIREVIDKDGR